MNYDQPFRTTAVTSKMAQLIVIDLIYMEVFNKNYERNMELVEKGTALINK